MEEGTPINFRALRAKFQEEAFQALSKANRPTVADKPKHIPPPGANTPGDNKTPVAPRVMVKDGASASCSIRANSLQISPNSAQDASRLEGSGRFSLKNKHMPLVLPVLPGRNFKKEPAADKEPKMDSDLGKDVPPHVGIKKIGLLLPFKSAKLTKLHVENGKETAVADGELSSVERPSAEDGASVTSDLSTSNPPSSPDVPATPPLSDGSHSVSDSRIISTLEKAKRKFSQRQSVTPKPRGVHSPDLASEERTFVSPPRTSGGFSPTGHTPLSLPHIACISARPFFKATPSTHKLVFEKQNSRDSAEEPRAKSAAPQSSGSPRRIPLPDPRTLGPPPAKPPRPLCTDLSRYQTPKGKVDSSDQIKEQPLTLPLTPHLDAPDFPDFESSEPEAEAVALNIAALEIEAKELGAYELHLPPAFGIPDLVTPRPELLACDPEDASEVPVVHDLNLGSQNIIPLDPAKSPDPINLPEFTQLTAARRWSIGQERGVESVGDCHCDEPELVAGESRSVPQESELIGQAAGGDGIQTHSGAHQQDDLYDMSENVYEDVENTNRLISKQVLIKKQDPYGQVPPHKEEPSHNKRPKHHWGSLSGEHQPAIYHIHRERMSPTTADHKEQKKREKQRLEREKKEQKEREKKENEMKKKFKVTGDEEPMYHAKVTFASKVRKNDLPVKSGETVSIIRTTNCPKGKWLARDSNNKYGYISVMNVELNIKEMLELGKKAQAAGRGANQDGDAISIGSRSSSHPVMTSSFTDDSEEWACDDEFLLTSNESHSFPQQNISLPETSCVHDGDANLEDTQPQNRHEALQKLAFFFQHKDESGGVAAEEATPANAETPDYLYVEEPPYIEEAVDFTVLEILPPPPLYADHL